MTGDLELQRWMDDWQASEVPGTPPARIRDHVRRRSRLLALWIAGEAIVGVGGLAFVLYWIVAVPDRVHQLLMSALAAVIIAVLVFDVWNWRGTLRASAEDTRTFMILSIERLRRVRRAIGVSWLLLAMQVAVFTPWIAYRLYYREPAATMGQQVFAWGLLIGMSASAIVWTRFAARWVDRDTDVLESLARELRE
jgi:hypothetical protein